MLERYDAATTWMWVQEEPRNAGAWTWISDTFDERLGRPLDVVSRPANASPAVGSAGLHRIEQEAVLNAAFGRSPNASNEPVEQDS